MNDTCGGGARVLSFMTASADEDIFAGGARSLKDLCMLAEEMEIYSDMQVFEEYVFDPSTYVLNGNLFALLGLADWANGSTAEYGKEIAASSFMEGVAAMEVLLPYYDYYGWSAYALTQLTAEDESIAPSFGVSYAHKYHIDLLYILADLSGSDVFSQYAARFKDYVDDPFWSQTSVLFRG